ncbi:MAG: pyruvate dehydrogenase (acetyl-transferring) E1 component subunit alpha [Alphaproteobacteria bacterium]|nr:pyruvate dehydrogenase (acetyl-transferring) E1 component subunit alpha [Alphaproteobacteria bacterium]
MAAKRPTKKATEKRQPARKARRRAVPKKGGNGERDKLLGFYRRMLLIRRFEEKAGQLYGMGLIGGFCHLYIGQEAVVVGALSTIDPPKDSFITAYRCHGHVLESGVEPKTVMAELTGRAPGLCKGKGGSMHFFAPDKGFFGGHGIVGAPAPLGTGLAFAHKYRKDDGVVLAFFGEGAANQGQVYEAFNMASLWKLPIVYIIENNRYGMGTAVERASAIADMYKHGESVGIPGKRIDGMDVLAVEKAVKAAVDHARGGKGPVLLEMRTYRYRGHSMSDPAKYRSREEVAKIREKRDPIDHLSKELLSNSKVKEEDLKAIDREVKAIVAEAADFAQESPEPDPDELFTNVLVEA